MYLLWLYLLWCLGEEVGAGAEVPRLEAGDEHGVDEVRLASPAHLVRGRGRGRGRVRVGVRVRGQG